MHPLAYVAAALVGAGLVLVFTGQALRIRAAGGEAEGVAPARARLSSVLERALDRLTAPLFGSAGVGGAAAELSRAGVRMRPQEWYALRAAVTALGFVLAILLWGSVLLAVLVAAAALLAPRAWLRVAERRRRARIERQLPEALILMANAMEVGAALYDALRTVDETMPEPIAEEFRRINLEVELGRTLEEALDRAARRLRSGDLAMVVSAVHIHRQLGGSLAEILRAITETMKDRVKLKERLRVLTAQARASAYIISALPLVLLFALLIIAPAYITPLFTTTVGLAALTLALAMIALAFFLMSRISRIDL